MNETMKNVNEILCKEVIKNLKSRNMSGYYCETMEDARNTVLSLIEDGRMVSWGGSVTLKEIGIKEKLLEKDLYFFDALAPCDPEEGYENRKRALLSDVFLMSTNAVTLDGELINIDGRGNRVAALIFGPKKVIIVAGVNKITRDLEEGMARVKRISCFGNCIRLKKKTPCALTGRCADCMIPGQTVCCNTVLTRFSYIPDRIHVVLVNKHLGV